MNNTIDLRWQNGLILIEVLVTIAVLTVVAAVVVPVATNVVGDA